MEEDYQRLNINSHSSNEEIKKAYQKKALLLHPDKGGDSDSFNLLKSSYDNIIKKKEKTSFNDSFLQKDYINAALKNRFQRMETFEEKVEKELMNYTSNFYSESTKIIEVNGKKMIEKKINRNGEIKIERYDF
jgi:DnaJ-class molecular chaperone